MKCIILAAGYATRLYPLTENFPKPLLPVKGKAIIDWLLEDVDLFPEITEHIIITNDRFRKHFETWRFTRHYKKPIHLVSDGSTTNENRLGAVRDLELAVRLLQLQEDALVLAGDNLLNFTLRGFLEYFQERKSSCIMYYMEKDLEKQKKTAIITMDQLGRVQSMTEKPEKPESCWAVPPFYLYTPEDLQRIGEAIAEGCGTDAPGSFAAWLASHSNIYAYPMPGKRYDIGNLETYQHAKDVFHEKPVRK